MKASFPPSQALHADHPSAVSGSALPPRGLRQLHVLLEHPHAYVVRNACFALYQLACCGANAVDMIAEGLVRRLEIGEIDPHHVVIDGRCAKGVVQVRPLQR